MQKGIKDEANRRRGCAPVEGWWGQKRWRRRFYLYGTGTMAQREIPRRREELEKLFHGCSRPRLPCFCMWDAWQIWRGLFFFNGLYNVYYLWAFRTLSFPILNVMPNGLWSMKIKLTKKKESDFSIDCWLVICRILLV